MEFLQALAVSLISSMLPAVLVIVCLRKIEEVRLHTNSMREQLIRVTGESEHAKGVLEGKAESAAGTK